MPEGNDDGIIGLFDRHHVGTLARIVVVDDEGRCAFQQVFNEPLLDRIRSIDAVFPAAFLSQINAIPV
ncbi:hypothetical protein D3C87_2023670 [compost metagenome]